MHKVCYASTDSGTFSETEVNSTCHDDNNSTMFALDGGIESGSVGANLGPVSIGDQGGYDSDSATSGTTAASDLDYMRSPSGRIYDLPTSEQLLYAPESTSPERNKAAMRIQKFWQGYRSLKELGMTSDMHPKHSEHERIALAAELANACTFDHETPCDISDVY